MDDGRKVIKIAHPEHSSGELKKKQKELCLQVLILVKRLNSLSFNKLIYKDLIMAKFLCKSNKIR